MYIFDDINKNWKHQSIIFYKRKKSLDNIVFFFFCFSLIQHRQRGHQRRRCHQTCVQQVYVFEIFFILSVCQLYVDSVFLSLDFCGVAFVQYVGYCQWMVTAMSAGEWCSIFNFVFVCQLGMTGSQACDNYSFFPVVEVWCLLVKVLDTFVQLNAFSCFPCIVSFVFATFFAMDYLAVAGD